MKLMFEPTFQQLCKFDGADSRARTGTRRGVQGTMPSLCSCQWRMGEPQGASEGEMREAAVPAASGSGKRGCRVGTVGCVCAVEKRQGASMSRLHRLKIRGGERRINWCKMKKTYLLVFSK